MKKIHLLFLILLGYVDASAQKYVPKIAAGTEVVYTVSKDGESIGFHLNISSMSDSLKMNWEVNDYGSGSYVMTKNSLENGKTMLLKVPLPDEVTELSSNETMGFISRSAFKSIARNKFMEFDNMKYSVKANSTPIKVDDKELDVIRTVSADGKNELWILNNPDFPLICKNISGVAGASLTLRYIK